MTTNADYGDAISTALNVVNTHEDYYGGGLPYCKKHLGELRDAFWENRVHIDPPEPNVEVFGPGDVLRNKETGTVFHLSTDGYWAGGVLHPYGEDFGWAFPRKKEFTSARYEKIGMFGSSEWRTLNDDSE